MRTFVALEPPPLLTAHLELLGGGIPGARWETSEKMHLTLRFIGEIEGRELSDLVDALARIKQHPLTLEVASVGHFPPRGEPRSLWAGIRPNPELHALAAKVEQAALGVGLEPERRNFAPHITLARLRNAPAAKVGAFLAHHSLFAAEPWRVERFGLFSSVLNPRGSSYRAEAWFDLT